MNTTSHQCVTGTIWVMYIFTYCMSYINGCKAESFNITGILLPYFSITAVISCDSYCCVTYSIITKSCQIVQKLPNYLKPLSSEKLRQKTCPQNLCFYLCRFCQFLHPLFFALIISLRWLCRIRGRIGRNYGIHHWNASLPCFTQELISIDI